MALLRNLLQSNGDQPLCASGRCDELPAILDSNDILQYDNELGVPWKAKDLYLKLSYPLLEADKRMHTPTLYMGGTGDFNVPILGGEQMYQALRSLGVPTELVVYPGQFHGFTRPSYIRDRYERWLAWYDKYLKPNPETKQTNKK